MPGIRVIEDIKSQIARIRTRELQYIISNEQAEMDKYDKVIAKDLDDLHKMQDDYVKLLQTPEEKQISRVLKALQDEKAGPVFIHCKRGADRTGVAIACYRMEHDGWSNRDDGRFACTRRGKVGPVQQMDVQLRHILKTRRLVFPKGRIEHFAVFKSHGGRRLRSLQRRAAQKMAIASQLVVIGETGLDEGRPLAVRHAVEKSRFVKSQTYVFHG